MCRNTPSPVLVAAAIPIGLSLCPKGFTAFGLGQQDARTGAHQIVGVLGFFDAGLLMPAFARRLTEFVNRIHLTLFLDEEFVGSLGGSHLVIQGLAGIGHCVGTGLGACGQARKGGACKGGPGHKAQGFSTGSLAESIEVLARREFRPRARAQSALAWSRVMARTRATRSIRKLNFFIQSQLSARACLM